MPRWTSSRLKWRANHCSSPWVQGMRRSLSFDNHTYWAWPKIHVHADTARADALAPPWTEIPLSSTSVVASESSTSGQPGAVENRLAASVSETSSDTTQEPAGMAALSG